MADFDLDEAKDEAVSEALEPFLKSLRPMAFQLPDGVTFDAYFEAKNFVAFCEGRSVD